MKIEMQESFLKDLKVIPTHVVVTHKENKTEMEKTTTCE